LILIGLIALTVFLLTLQIGQADLLVFLLGASLSALGLILRRRSARRHSRHSGRFQTLRRLSGQDPEEDED
jgi:hypothetical protein